MNGLKGKAVSANRNALYTDGHDVSLLDGIMFNQDV